MGAGATMKRGAWRRTRLLARCVAAGLLLAPGAQAGPPEARAADANATPVASPSPAPPTTPAAPNEAWSLEALRYTADAGPIRRASDQLHGGDARAALQTLSGLTSSAAALVAARAHHHLGDASAATAALVLARRAPELAALVDMELGLLALDRNDWAACVQLLLPLLEQAAPLAGAAARALPPALARHQPQGLLDRFALLQRLQPPGDGEARSLLLEAQALAYERLGHADTARGVRLQRFIEEPVATATPASPPAGVVLSEAQRLERIGNLVAAHRNERAIAELEALPEVFAPSNGTAAPGGLPQATAGGNGLLPSASPRSDLAAPLLRCRRAFLYGTAARKLRRYARAEQQFAEVMQRCPQEEDLRRRAAFVHAKVISIRDGLRAIGPIEDFARRYPTHSMTDDVLFWAGDMYQRRGQTATALAYYQRIDKLPQNDDYCSEARWRLAWMAYKAGDMPAAQAALDHLAAGDGCSHGRIDMARVNYWRGRVAQKQQLPEQARQHFAAAVRGQPLSFYAQAALPRLLALQSAGANMSLSRSLLAASRGQHLPRLCAWRLGQMPAFHTAVALLACGLHHDATAFLRSLQIPGAAAMYSAADLRSCGPAQASLLQVLLLQQAGGAREAYARLQRSFGEQFNLPRQAADLLLWRTAYPLAFREALQASEQSHGLPTYFLQALAREESAFDPAVVSWAEAYGLTQLLLSSARAAGKMQHPPVQLQAAEELLEPRLNAQLGGALLQSMLRKSRGNLGLALVAYNAGDELAASMLRRFSGGDFVAFCEDIHIAETRAYVKRVLRTYGVYRWLYAASLPALPIEDQLPQAG